MSVGLVTGYVLKFRTIFTSILNHHRLYLLLTLLRVVSSHGNCVADKKMIEIYCDKQLACIALVIIFVWFPSNASVKFLKTCLKRCEYYDRTRGYSD